MGELQELFIVMHAGIDIIEAEVETAAALTYVAAFIATLGNLLWLMSVRDRR